MIKILKETLRPLYRICHSFKIQSNPHGLEKKRVRLLRDLKDKEVINVVFFALFDSTWKCDSLYRKMLSHPRFNPQIVICPVVNYGFENMVKRMRECAYFFEDRGYQYCKAYNEEKKKFMNVKKQLHPDIIFYTNPYKGLIHDKYYLDKYDDVLTCYIPYFYESGNEEMFYNLDFHNNVWRYFVESEELKQEQEAKLNRTRKNVSPVGFCPFDEFKALENRYKHNGTHKTIVWAPHHMINENNYLRDGFLKYNDLFFDLADKYDGKVRFIFRPHPLLKNKLELFDGWGKERTREYYTKWNNHRFCSIEENCSYIELFKESNAMIHDCGSFITEYLYENKPALFTGTDVFTTEKYWKTAIDAIECYYRTDCSEGIEDFVRNVINEAYDEKKEKRESFIAKYLHPEYDVAQNIIDDILYSIDNQTLYRN